MIAFETLRTTFVEGVRVSTIRMPDHSFGVGEPQEYETMIIGGPRDGQAWRYATEHQALAGHEQAVAWGHE